MKNIAIKSISALALIGALSVSSLFMVQMNTAQAADANDSIRIGAGYFDAFDSYDAVELHAEYHTPYVFMDMVRPFVGVMGTSDSSIYGYGGLRVEIDLNQDWQLVPAFAAGAYADGKDLGHKIEFRSALEVNYRLENDARIGASIYHLSNASLGDSNPGTEVITLHYTYPLNI